MHCFAIPFDITSLSEEAPWCEIFSLNFLIVLAILLQVDDTVKPTYTILLSHSDGSPRYWARLYHSRESMTGDIICHCLKTTTKSLIHTTSISTPHTWAQNSKVTVFIGSAVSRTHKTNSYCDTIDIGNTYLVSILTS